jgi:ribose 5-phosphate isomerase RpiB
MGSDYRYFKLVIRLTISIIDYRTALQVINSNNGQIMTFGARLTKKMAFGRLQNAFKLLFAHPHPRPQDFIETVIKRPPMGYDTFDDK